MAPTHSSPTHSVIETASADPFATQLALSRVHAQLVPMLRLPSGYELDPIAEGWFELPAARGFAGYGLGRALRLLLDLLGGLSALHATLDISGRPFVHGEVGLPQLRVDPSGVCRLVPLTARHALSAAAEQAGGSLRHLSPDRLLKESADVFGSGVLLWEALAGRRLFDGAVNLGIMDRLMGEKLIVPPLPPELAWAIPLKLVAAKALSVDAEERFADCAELGAAIASIARDRVASHLDVANFLGTKAHSIHSIARERAAPTQSATFSAVSPPSSRGRSTLAALGPRTQTPVPASAPVSGPVSGPVSTARPTVLDAPQPSPFSALLVAKPRTQRVFAPARSRTLTSMGTPEAVQTPTEPEAQKSPVSSSRPSKRPPLPAADAMPSISAADAMPSIPAVDAMPSIPAADAMPSIPAAAAPSLSPSAALPSVSAFAAFPSVPAESLPRIPVLPTVPPLLLSSVPTSVSLPPESFAPVIGFPGHRKSMPALWVVGALLVVGAAWALFANDAAPTKPAATPPAAAVAPSPVPVLEATQAERPSAAPAPSELEHVSPTLPSRPTPLHGSAPRVAAPRVTAPHPPAKEGSAPPTAQAKDYGI